MTIVSIGGAMDAESAVRDYYRGDDLEGVALEVLSRAGYITAAMAGTLGAVVMVARAV